MKNLKNSVSMALLFSLFSLSCTSHADPYYSRGYVNPFAAIGTVLFSAVVVGAALSPPAIEYVQPAYQLSSVPQVAYAVQSVQPAQTFQPVLVQQAPVRYVYVQPVSYPVYYQSPIAYSAIYVGGYYRRW